MDELLIMAFIRMAYEKPLSLKRLPNGYCGDHPEKCEICAARPWWEIEFEGVGPVVVGWRKRVIVIDWSKTGRQLMPKMVTEDDVTKNAVLVHAYGYGKAIMYLQQVLDLLRRQRRDEERKENQ